jgi:hypothetical protein
MTIATRASAVRRSTSVVAAALTIAFASSVPHLVKPLSARAEFLCANGGGSMHPYEGKVLWFTMTHHSYWRLWTDSGLGGYFNAVRRRPDGSISHDAHVWYEYEFFNDGGDANRRTEMYNENGGSGIVWRWYMDQWALNSCG